MSGNNSVIENRLQQLENHLKAENPILLNAVQSFRKLDRVAYQMGLLDENDSYATQIPWWPLISILGTFSAGKSTFINHYLGAKLQRSGNQAVDDKFSVLSFSHNQESRTLPGIALDSDPRFPFYKISSEIERVASGEGSRIDAYLQLKTCPSEALRGKILIDSPGFDADAQRTSTLKITNHIIDLSDLVLVFFDARHPEPGAMRDTLDHLVSNTIQRADSGKFLYILNQLDTTAHEDNPEEVVAAWQRALGERGLTAGRFYTTYNAEAANPIEDAALRQRFEKKRDSDLSDIHERMQQVEVERAYRIVANLEKTARDFSHKAVPALLDMLSIWRKRTLIGDGILLLLLLLGFLFLKPDNIDWQWFTPLHTYLSILGAYAIWLLLHFGVRRLSAKSVLGSAGKIAKKYGLQGNLKAAFKLNTLPWRSIFSQKPKGWSKKNQRLITRVTEESDQFVQSLNDSFTNPSGQKPEVATNTPG
jgi:ribosome biogenesis GTPase A